MPDNELLRNNVDVFLDRMNDLLVKLSEAIENDDTDEQRTVLEAIVGNVDILKAALQTD
jgi:hypothetical protein